MPGILEAIMAAGWLLLGSAPSAPDTAVQVIPIRARRYAFSPARITVCRGRPVRFVLRAEDTKHGLEIRDLKIKVSLPRHQTVTVEFTPEKLGRHPFRCHHYCGRGHKRMRGVLFVRECRPDEPAPQPKDQGG